MRRTVHVAREAAVECVNRSYYAACRCKISGCKGSAWRSTGGLCLTHWNEDRRKK